MDATPLNRRAYDLHGRLSKICSELTDLALDVGMAFPFSRDDRYCEASYEFDAAVDAVKAACSKLHGCDLVIDAVRDPGDQSFAFCRIEHAIRFQPN